MADTSLAMTRDRQGSRHAIGEMVVDFTVSDAGAVMNSPEEVLIKARTELLPELEALLDGSALAEADATIEIVELDLGLWPADPDWHKVRDTFREALWSAIQPYLRWADDGAEEVQRQASDRASILNSGVQLQKTGGETRFPTALPAEDPKKVGQPVLSASDRSSDPQEGRHTVDTSGAEAAFYPRGDVPADVEDGQGKSTRLTAESIRAEKGSAAKGSGAPSGSGHIPQVSARSADDTEPADSAIVRTKADGAPDDPSEDSEISVDGVRGELREFAHFDAFRATVLELLRQLRKHTTPASHRDVAISIERLFDRVPGRESFTDDVLSDHRVVGSELPVDELIRDIGEEEAMLLSAVIGDRQSDGLSKRDAFEAALKKLVHDTRETAQALQPALASHTASLDASENSSETLVANVLRIAARDAFRRRNNPSDRAATGVNVLLQKSVSDKNDLETGAPDAKLVSSEAFRNIREILLSVLTAAGHPVSQVKAFFALLDIGSMPQAGAERQLSARVDNATVSLDAAADPTNTTQSRPQQTDRSDTGNSPSHQSRFRASGFDPQMAARGPSEIDMSREAITGPPPQFGEVSRPEMTEKSKLGESSEVSRDNQGQSGQTDNRAEDMPEQDGQDQLAIPAQTGDKRDLAQESHKQTSPETPQDAHRESPVTGHPAPDFPGAESPETEGEEPSAVDPSWKESTEFDTVARTAGPSLRGSAPVKTTASDKNEKSEVTSTEDGSLVDENKRPLLELEPDNAFSRVERDPRRSDGTSAEQGETTAAKGQNSEVYEGETVGAHRNDASTDSTGQPTREQPTGDRATDVLNSAAQRPQASGVPQMSSERREDAGSGVVPQFTSKRPEAIANRQILFDEIAPLALDTLTSLPGTQRQKWRHLFDVIWSALPKASSGQASTQVGKVIESNTTDQQEIYASGRQYPQDQGEPAEDRALAINAKSSAIPSSVDENGEGFKESAHSITPVFRSRVQRSRTGKNEKAQEYEESPLTEEEEGASRAAKSEPAVGVGTAGASKGDPLEGKGTAGTSKGDPLEGKGAADTAKSQPSDANVRSAGSNDQAGPAIQDHQNLTRSRIAVDRNQDPLLRGESGEASIETGVTAAQSDGKNNNPFVESPARDFEKADPWTTSHRSTRSGETDVVSQDDGTLLQHDQKDQSNAASTVSRAQDPQYVAALVELLGSPIGPDDDFMTHLEHILLRLFPQPNARTRALRHLSARLGYADGATSPVLRRRALAAVTEIIQRERDAASRAQGSSPIAPPKDETTARAYLSQRAGLVLFATYLPLLFERLGVLDEKRQIKPSDLPRARRALQLLGEADTLEIMRTDPLEKTLLGLPQTWHFDKRPADPAPDAALINGLINAVIKQWGALGQTSVSGMQDSFVKRAGTLRAVDEGWTLTVEQGPFDMLLDRLPWSFDTIALPWMDVPLHVTWRPRDD